MKIIPQQSRIVVEVIDDAAVGDILIPEKEFRDKDDLPIEKPFRVRVVAVGPGRLLENGTLIRVPLSEGDEVYCDGRYATPMKPEYFYGNRRLLVVDYAGVLAKVEREPGEPVISRKPAVVRARELVH